LGGRRDTLLEAAALAEELHRLVHLLERDASLLEEGVEALGRRGARVGPRDIGTEAALGRSVVPRDDAGLHVGVRAALCLQRAAPGDGLGPRALGRHVLLVDAAELVHREDLEAFAVDGLRHLRLDVRVLRHVAE
ncbi:MAG: hypothetical protein ACK559_33200, partial [bacterium]